MCPFDYTAFVVSGKVGYPVNGFNHTSEMTAVTPTDRPKSVRNRCVIEVLVAFLCCPLLFEFFCWHRGFRHRSETDLLFSLQ